MAADFMATANASGLLKAKNDTALSQSLTISEEFSDEKNYIQNVIFPDQKPVVQK